jgi:hypothetical protein
LNQKRCVIFSLAFDSVTNCLSQCDRCSKFTTPVACVVEPGKRRCDRCAQAKQRCSFVGVGSASKRQKKTSTVKEAGVSLADGVAGAVTGPLRRSAFVGKPPPSMGNPVVRSMGSFGEQAGGGEDQEWKKARIAVLRRDLLITRDQIALQEAVAAAFESQIAKIEKSL